MKFRPSFLGYNPIHDWNYLLPVVDRQPLMLANRFVHVIDQQKRNVQDRGNHYGN